MRRLVFFGILGVVVSSAVFANQPDRAELLGSPKVIEGAVGPVFVDLTTEQLKQQLMVVSSRSYAFYGFNNSEVQIHLPRCDNSIYASVEFSPARLGDSQGNEVQFERERGIYDHDTHSDELRFTPVEGKTPAEFARVEGTITLRYPLRMRTVVVKPGGAAPVELTVALDGPFVVWSDPQEMLPEAASFTPVEQFRAFGASGRRLEQNSWKGFSMSGGLTTETYAYWGEVAELRLDVVEEWANLEISYSLPSIEPLPASRVGTAPENLEVTATPGGAVDVRIVKHEEPQADVSGSPPLSLLVMKCDATELVQAFIDGGADLAVKLPGNMTLRQMARLTKCSENARVLKEAGTK